jgi:hypothetical protein
VWHSFESRRFRPATMVSTSPQRYWQTQLAPVPSAPIPFPFFTAAEQSAVTHHMFEIGFLVSKAGVITAMPGSDLESLSTAGLSFDVVHAITD